MEIKRNVNQTIAVKGVGFAKNGVSENTLLAQNESALVRRIIMSFFFTHPSLRRSCSSKTDLSYLTHYSPLLWGKVAMEKMVIINTFGPVWINGGT